MHLDSPLREIKLNDDGSVAAFHIGGVKGKASFDLTADAYVSALPVDPFKLLVPEPLEADGRVPEARWASGCPVINLHLWFDRKLTDIDHLLFSRSPLLSVYADMSITCKEYEDPDKSMLELVFAPAKDWIGRPDEEIIEATMGELQKLFPMHFSGDNPATLRKFKVVKTPSVGVQDHPRLPAAASGSNHPDQELLPRGRLHDAALSGLDGGAVLSGKLCAAAVDRKTGSAGIIDLCQRAGAA